MEATLTEREQHIKKRVIEAVKDIIDNDLLDLQMVVDILHTWKERKRHGTLKFQIRNGEVISGRNRDPGIRTEETWIVPRARIEANSKPEAPPVSPNRDDGREGKSDKEEK